MNLNLVKDNDLLIQMRQLIQSERDLSVSILHHLREIERRRLFADLGYSSLFDYAVGELKYSEGQAGRRIAAMRLLKDLPADAAARIETKITTGELSLSNVQQASSFFRDQSLAAPRRAESLTPMKSSMYCSFLRINQSGQGRKNSCDYRPRLLCLRKKNESSLTRRPRCALP